mgnify:CR=1 FL=1
MMPLDPNIDYEHLPPGTEFDERDVNLRSYFCDMSDEVLSTYNPEFTDAELMEWDENFTEEGILFLMCSERDVDTGEYRRVLKVHLEHRALEV